MYQSHIHLTWMKNKLVQTYSEIKMINFVLLILE